MTTRKLTHLARLARLAAVLMGVGFCLPAWSALTVNAGNGTVTDTITSLVWEQCAQGKSGASCTTGTATTFTWAAALTAASTANTAVYKGFSDWRLPNKNELESIVKIDSSSPAIDSTVFPATPSGYFWTSTTYAPNPSAAWSVYFDSGVPDADYKTSTNYVRLVRSGQSLASFDALAPVVVAPDPTPAIPLLSVTINGVGPGTLPSILNMGAGDGPSFLSQVIGLLSNTLGMPLSLVEQNANGTVTLRGFNGDNLNFVPFSFQSVDARANGIYPIGYGQYQVVFNGRSISMAPVLTRLDQLIALFPGMTVAMAETGALTASLNGTTYVVQPGLAVQLGQATGAARLVLGADGLYRFTDAQGNTQVLYPAFVAPAILRRALQAIDPAATMTIELDATATTVVDGIRYALVPDLTLGGLRTEDLGKYFWTDGLNRYRMWVNIGVSQGTAFKPK